MRQLETLSIGLELLCRLEADRLYSCELCCFHFARWVWVESLANKVGLLCEYNVQQGFDVLVREVEVLFGVLG